MTLLCNIAVIRRLNEKCVISNRFKKVYNRNTAGVDSKMFPWSNFVTRNHFTGRSWSSEQKLVKRPSLTMPV